MVILGLVQSHDGCLVVAVGFDLDQRSQIFVFEGIGEIIGCLEVDVFLSEGGNYLLVELGDEFKIKYYPLMTDRVDVFVPFIDLGVDGRHVKIKVLVPEMQVFINDVSV